MLTLESHMGVFDNLCRGSNILIVKIAKIVSHYIIEVKFIATNEACKGLLWITKFLKELELKEGSMFYTMTIKVPII